MLICSCFFQNDFSRFERCVVDFSPLACTATGPWPACLSPMTPTAASPFLDSVPRSTGRPLTSSPSHPPRGRWGWRGWWRRIAMCCKWGWSCGAPPTSLRPFATRQRARLRRGARDLFSNIGTLGCVFLLRADACVLRQPFVGCSWCAVPKPAAAEVLCVADYYGRSHHRHGPDKSGFVAFQFFEFFFGNP